MWERRKILLQRVLAYYDIVQIVFVIYRYADLRGREEV